MHRLLLAAALAAAAVPAAAGPFAPGGNSGALARSFALPALGDSRVLPEGGGETRLTLDIANEYVREGDFDAGGNCVGAECITLDGETRRLNVDYRVGLGGGWDFSMHVPMVDRGGGFLDSWIQDWHRWFGLPNGGREFAADDQYHYRYERGGAVLLSETEDAKGLGDVSLGLGRALGPNSALRTLVRLPTGDGSALSGDNTGGAVWLDVGLPMSGGWDGYIAGGYSRNELGDVLTALQNREVLFGGIGLLAPLSQNTRLLLQVNAHSRLYDGSELTPLARPAVPLTVGLQFRTGDEGALDIGFKEDLSVNGSPDFVFYLSVGSVPRR